MNQRPIGSLSPEDIMNTCPMLMSAWAEAPEKLNLSSDNGRERALAVEGLLKRMIDERKAGNTEAIAKTEDYNAVMKAWSMSGEGSKAALRAEQVSSSLLLIYNHIHSSYHLTYNSSSSYLINFRFSFKCRIYTPLETNMYSPISNHFKLPLRHGSGRQMNPTLLPVHSKL
jgi:hypothetical protein